MNFSLKACGLLLVAQHFQRVSSGYNGSRFSLLFFCPYLPSRFALCERAISALSEVDIQYYCQTPAIQGQRTESHYSKRHVTNSQYCCSHTLFRNKNSIRYCPDNRLTDGGKAVSPTHRPHSTLFFCFWCSFLLEAE
jgi:hypothetical protein